MKKSLVLHIGMGKTGTSALQQFFSRNRLPLAKKDISYPKLGAVDGAHHLISPHIPPFLQGIWKFLPVEKWAPQLAKKRENRILLSSELIAWADENLVNEFCASASEWFDLTVVIYLRRQDNIIMSGFTQQVITGKQKRRIVDIYKNGMRRYNYESILQPWEMAIGVNNILVRPYERRQLYSQNIVCDFMHHVFAIDVGKNFFLDNKLPNKSLSRVPLEYKRLINNVVDGRGKEDKVTQLLMQFSEETEKDCDSRGSDYSLLPPDIRLAIVMDSEEANQTIARKYLGRDSGYLFLDPLPDPDEDWRGNTLSKAEAASVSGYLKARDLALMQSFYNELRTYFDAERKSQRRAARLLADSLFDDTTLLNERRYGI